MKLQIYSKFAIDVDLLFHAAMRMTNNLTKIDQYGSITNGDRCTIGWFAFGDRPRPDDAPLWVLTVSLDDPHVSKEDLVRGLYDIGRGLCDGVFTEYGMYGCSSIGGWSWHKEVRKKAPWWCFDREYDYERKSIV